MKNKKGAWFIIPLIFGIITFLFYIVGGALSANKLTEITKSIPSWFWIVLIILLFFILMKKKK